MKHHTKLLTILVLTIVGSLILSTTCVVAWEVATRIDVARRDPLKIFGSSASTATTYYANLKGNVNDDTFRIYDACNDCCCPFWCNLAGGHYWRADGWHVERKTIIPNQKYRILIRGISKADCCGGNPGYFKGSAWVNSQNAKITTLEKCRVEGSWFGQSTYCYKSGDTVYFAAGSLCGGCCCCPDSGSIDVSFIVETNPPDTQPPTLDYFNTPPAGWVASCTMQLSWSCSDNVGLASDPYDLFVYHHGSWHEIGWGSYTTYTYHASEGDYVRFALKCKDVNGNVGGPWYRPTGGFVRCDETPPTVGISGAPTEWQITPATITVTCSDSLSGCDSTSYKLKVFSTNPGSCPTDYGSYDQTPPLTVSSHVWVCAAAKDNAGNVGFSSPVEIKILTQQQLIIQLNLAPGWNLVSVPFTKVKSISLDDCGIENETLHYLNRVLEEWEDVTWKDLEGGKAYWYYNPHGKGCRIEIEGIDLIKIADVPQLKKGYNLIGATWGGFNISAHLGTCNLEPRDGKLALYWNSTTKKWEATNFLERGRGYWVYTRNDCNLG